MIKLAVSGMGRDRIVQVIKEVGGDRVEAFPKTDFEAALAVQSGTADYYIGACQSGAGGALGVANAVLGSSNVARLSGTGTAPDPEMIEAAVRDGKRAFGIANTHIETAVPPLVEAILRRAETETDKGLT